MISVLVSGIAWVAMGAAFALIVGKIMPILPNQVWRFAFLFLLGIPMMAVMTYIDVRTLGYHKMGPTAIVVIALLVAVWGTFWPPQTQKTNIP